MLICPPRLRAWLRYKRYFWKVLGLYIFVLFFIHRWISSHEEPIPEPASSNLLVNVSQSTIIRKPRFLILDINNQHQSLCKPIYEEIIPVLKSFHMTNKEFIQTFFGRHINPSYIAYSNDNLTALNMIGEYCSNNTHQSILFIAYPKIAKINSNVYPTRSVGSILKNEYHCRPLDFKECSLDNSTKDYPQLFEFHSDEIISSNGGASVGKESFRLIYHYIRRHPMDYARYRWKLIKSTPKPLTIAVTVDLSTSRSIHLKIEMKQNQTANKDLKCLATLRGSTLSRRQVFQMANRTIVFNDLIPLSAYNICVTCDGMTNRICELTKTLGDRKIRSVESQNISYKTTAVNISPQTSSIRFLIITLAFVLLIIAISFCIVRYLQKRMLRPYDLQTMVYYIPQQCRSYRNRIQDNTNADGSSVQPANFYTPRTEIERSEEEAMPHNLLAPRNSSESIKSAQDVYNRQVPTNSIHILK